jgi:hypothetical protein
MFFVPDIFDEAIGGNGYGSAMAASLPKCRATVELLPDLPGFTHWQWPLCSGQVFGMAGRILVFITGLACPVLFVTGMIRWLQKRKAEGRIR